MSKKQQFSKMTVSVVLALVGAGTRRGLFGHSSGK